MPFYARLGFAVVPPEELSDALRAVVDDENPAWHCPLSSCRDETAEQMEWAAA
jgi:hypothetical protein